MAQEIEAKFLNIEISDLENKLKSLGAIFEGEKFFRSTSFDYAGFPLDKDCAWVRLRDEGDKVTLAYKKRLGVTSEGGNDKGMEEVEIEVSNYEKTKEIFLKIGMVVKFSQEKKRRTWTNDSVTFDIDTWPMLKPYLEIEAGTWEEIDLVAKELGFKEEDKKICSATQIYSMNGINDKDYIEITFDKQVKR